MALNPVNPIQSGSATATNGSPTITVTGGVDCSFIVPGFILQLGTRRIVTAISGTSPVSGTSTITLAANWDQPTTTDVLIGWNSYESLPNIVNRIQNALGQQTAIGELTTNGLIEKTGVNAYQTVAITAFAKTLLDDADAAAARTTLSAQASGATLTAMAGVTTAANKIIYFTGVDAAAAADLSAYGRTLIATADAAAARTALSAQPLDATLTAVAGVTTAANKIIYFTGVDAAATADLSVFGRSVIAAADAAAVNALLGTNTVIRVSDIAALKSTVVASDNTAAIVAEYNTGTDLGGGVFFWNSTSTATADDMTIFAVTGVTTGRWLRQYEFLTVQMAGAVGGGVTNDTASVSRAIAVASALRKPLFGSNVVYGVSGDITLPSWSWLVGIRLKQLLPVASNRRTLFQTGGEFCRMDDVVVDRNGDGSSGSLTDAAGVWINNCPSVKLTNVEVFGNDAGSGIAIISCDNADIENPYVHDITAGTVSSSAVTDDTVHGVWVQGGTSVRVLNPRVRNLLNRWSGQAAFNKFSRGVVIGGAKRFSISSPMIDNVDQGVDITGDQNPEFFEVNGGIVSNCYTWGAKCANSVQNGTFTGVIAYRCGQSGFVASAPSNITPDLTQNITYNGCKSIQTGFGGAWTSSANVAGFRVAGTPQYPDYPRSIKFIGCSADGSGGVMEYGFFSDATLASSNGETWVEAIHCDVQGATIKNYFGIQTGYARKRRSGTAQLIPNDTWTDLDYTETIDYMGASIGATAPTLLAARSGVYMVSAGVTFSANANGNRGVRILVDGSVIPGSTVRIVVGDANERNIATTVPVAIAAAGAQIKVQVLQSSGGALDVVGPTAFNMALISAGFGG